MVGLDGKQRLTVELDGDIRSLFDGLREHDVDVSLKRYRPKRSTDANAYAWVLIDKLAEALNVTKTQIYRRAIRGIGGVSDVVCVREQAVQRLSQEWRRNGLGWQTETMPSKIPGCVTVVLYYGSSTYDSKQMSALIDSLVQDCQALGIETKSAEEIESLIRRFEHGTCKENH